MRLWSLHPKYLDTKGLSALWREALLAKHVLEGKTVGYRNHPQLLRFKEMKSPLQAINNYLSEIYKESLSRHYNFDEKKFDKNFKPIKMTVTEGQLEYEMKHLLKKLFVRDKDGFDRICNLQKPESFKLFTVVPGAIAEWEIR